MIYTDYRKNDLYTTIKIMLEDGYTVGEILEVIGSATDDFLVNIEENKIVKK